MSKVNEPSDVFKLVEMRGPDECWPFTGQAWGGRAREPRPYFMSNSRRMIAYRWVFELVNGVTLTPDQLILHSCDNGGAPIGCCNPAHLRLGTTAENMDDMKMRERHGLPHTVVRAIRRLLEQGQTQDEIARLYGLTREVVSSIATKRVYQHVKE
jgi:hypothetical protein